MSAIRKYTTWHKKIWFLHSDKFQQRQRQKATEHLRPRVSDDILFKSALNWAFYNSNQQIALLSQPTKEPLRRGSLREKILFHVHAYAHHKGGRFSKDPSPQSLESRCYCLPTCSKGKIELKPQVLRLNSWPEPPARIIVIVRMRRLLFESRILCLLFRRRINCLFAFLITGLPALHCFEFVHAVLKVLFWKNAKEKLYPTVFKLL